MSSKQLVTVQTEDWDMLMEVYSFPRYKSEAHLLK
jgi:hypothetical protein